jgi:hypothetical protein
MVGKLNVVFERMSLIAFRTVCVLGRGAFSSKQIGRINELFARAKYRFTDNLYDSIALRSLDKCNSCKQGANSLLMFIGLTDLN